MSQDPRAAEVGQIFLDKKAAQSKLDGLLNTARHLGEELEQLGDLLRRSPEAIKFNGVGFDPSYARTIGPSFELREVDGKAISDLATAIRDSMGEIRRLGLVPICRPVHLAM
jgi:hypothetical protein